MRQQQFSHMGFLAVQKLLDLLPFAIVGLFAGLMAGAFPAVTDEIKGAARTKKRVALFAVGLLVPIAVGIFSAVFSAEEAAVGNKFDQIAWWHLPIRYLAHNRSLSVASFLPTTNEEISDARHPGT